jgi:hypothetical protein
MNDTQERHDLTYGSSEPSPPESHSPSPRAGAAIAAQPRQGEPPKDALSTSREEKPPAFAHQGSDSENLPKTASQPEQGASL